ncbi:MAG: alpha-hydroxy-acid oxidizing protein [Acidimicrobiia bacterium]|nr:alpha-hydroxy-acid oxidizing protein [Acidimicrobiia bacterium]
MNRRKAVQCLAGFFAASPLARAQQDLPYSGERVPALEDLVNVFEFEPICKMRIPRQNYDFIAGGVDQEWSLRHNREAFDKISLRPRMLVDASHLDLSLTLFGDKLSCPILVAPTAGHAQANPEGEFATARAAAATETILILSTNSSHPLEKVAEASNFPKWFQLYPGPDLEGTWERIQRAMDSGYKTIVLTVDAGYNSHRERLLRNRLRTQTPPGVPSPQSRRARVREEETSTPSRPAVYGLTTTLMHKLDWRFFDELKKRSRVPVLIKGILVAEDAELAVKHGADGIVVSNHGARYLDYAPATIEVLAEIVDVVNRKMPILVDSGFRRGTDILKALAIGATAVCVGRPPLWGLGAYGEPGVRRVLELLRTELALAMGLCGKANLSQIDRKLVRM